MSISNIWFPVKRYSESVGNVNDTKNSISFIDKNGQTMCSSMNAKKVIMSYHQTASETLIRSTHGILIQKCKSYGFKHMLQSSGFHVKSEATYQAVLYPIFRLLLSQFLSHFC